MGRSHVVLALLLSIASATPVIVSLAYPEARLSRALFDISDPKSPRYGRHLNNEQLAALIAIPHATVSAVRAHLRELGCTAVTVMPHRDHVTAECGAHTRHALAALRAALHARHGAALAGVHHAPASDEPLTRATLGISRRAANRLAQLRKRQSVAGKRRYSGDPNSQRVAYGIPALQVGTNATNTQMVWGPGTYGYLPSDLAQFYSEWNVNSNVNSISTVGFQGVPGGDNFGECTLDVSYSTGIGNRVKTLVSNTNTSQSTEEGLGFGYAFLAFSANLSAQESVPNVLSLSLGSLSAYACDALCKYAVGMGVSNSDCVNYIQGQRQICMMDSVQQSQIISLQLAKLGLRGTTITAAAGDGGSHFSFQFFPDDHIGRVLNKISCQYNFDTFPASSPYVLAVGGTQWSGGGTPGAPVAWESGGSGFAWSFPRPAYQDAEVQQYLAANSNADRFPSAGSFNAQGRAYPDVAALADGIPMVEQGGDTETGGTSASAPEWAGVLSLINDIRLNVGLPPLGFVNVRLYQAMRTSRGSALFDVTVGNSRCALNGCCDQGFPATVGWDAVTGYGSPRWSGLVQYLAN